MVSNTFRVVGANLRELSILALLLAGLPAAVMGWGQIVLTGASGTGEIGDLGLASALMGIGFLALMIGSVLLQASTIRVAVGTLNGDKPSAFRELGKTYSVLLPLIGLGIVMMFAYGIAFLLLVVPAIILGVIWVIATPAYVMERPGVFGALGRSRDLTRGHRWPIFGLLVVYFVAYFVVSAVLGGIFVALSMIGGDLSAMAISSTISNALVGAISGVVTSAGISSIYYELRMIKEGVGAAQLAAVFD
ncbi:hypothetical protein [Phenylobacterium sp. LjRoot97]|uniref:hypothetical protein n=1 Tax=Phenylobacterium sp. LjRoot97 TaxID=3342344 RepID=UPI003F4F71CB